MYKWSIVLAMAVGTIMVWTVVLASWSRNCPLGCRRPSCPATVSHHFHLFWQHPNVLVQILQIHRPLPTRPPMFFWVLWSRWGWKSMQLTRRRKVTKNGVSQTGKVGKNQFKNKQYQNTKRKPFKGYGDCATHDRSRSQRGAKGMVYFWANHWWWCLLLWSPSKQFSKG